MNSQTTNKVAVIMSTYNGMRFIDEQIDSIQAQSFSGFDLIIRDDGSPDSHFRDYLKSLQKKYSNIQLYLEENVGVIKSFFKLVEICGNQYEYVSFADQDDIWMENKLKDAIETLGRRNNEIPQLYIGRVEFINAIGESIGKSECFKRTGFANALVQNLAGGCVSVINKKAIDKLLEVLPDIVLMHDWWNYIVVSAFGEVTYDSRLNFKYRQHESNVVGGTASFFKSWKRRSQRFFSQGANAYRSYDQAQEFFRLYGKSLPAKNYKIIKNYLDSRKSFGTRVRYIFKKNKVWRYKKLDSLVLNLLILINKY